MSLTREQAQKHAHRWTEEELREFIHLYMTAPDVKTVADHFGVTYASCSKIATRLRQEGIPLPRRAKGHIASRRNQLWTQEEVEYVVRRRKERATAESIAIELGRTFNAVQGMILKLRQEGVSVGMLGSGVRRLWSPERLKMAIAGRHLSIVEDKSEPAAKQRKAIDDAQVDALRKVVA